MAVRIDQRDPSGNSPPEVIVSIPFDGQKLMGKEWTLILRQCPTQKLFIEVQRRLDAASSIQGDGK